MKTHIHRDAGFKAGIGKGPVEQLSIAYDNVTGVADQ